MNEYLSPLLQDFASETNRAKTLFGSLIESQLNWKPDPKTWSVGECLEHLMTSNKTYLPQFERVLSGNLKKTGWQKMGFLNRFWGKMIRKAVDPVKVKKSTTPKQFRPTRSTLPANMVDEFVDHQREMEATFKSLMTLNHDEVIIRSPATGMINYSLKDACTILITHTTRHINQAEKLMQRTEFPKA